MGGVRTVEVDLACEACGAGHDSLKRRGGSLEFACEVCGHVTDAMAAFHAAHSASVGEDIDCPMCGKTSFKPVEPTDSNPMILQCENCASCFPLSAFDHRLDDGDAMVASLMGLVYGSFGPIKTLDVLVPACFSVIDVCLVDLTEEERRKTLRNIERAIAILQKTVAEIDGKVV